MVKRVRLISGLVLLAFVTGHLLNHALGLISLQALEDGRALFLGVWRNPFSTAVLVAATSAHIVTVLWAFYRRRGLGLRPHEIIQTISGIAIPLLLMTHFVGTHGAHDLFGVDDSYRLILTIHWVLDTDYIAIQMAGVIITWAHGCMGIHYWLRLKPWYDRVFPYLYAAFLIVPLLSLLGYAEAGREIAELAKTDGWVREQLILAGFPSNAQISQLIAIIDTARAVLVAAVVLVFIARFGRGIIELRRPRVSVTYPDGRVVSSPPGSTILEISRRFGIPHASVCGGRGRCSTCRVRVTDGIDGLAEASTDEQRVLDRIGHPINVRLACQTRPEVDIGIIPLLPPSAAPADSHRSIGQLQGEERDLAVLFADLRAFTKFSEQKLPYDVVFVLNRYFAGMGEAVEKSGGHLDKFIGDGVMALFGVDGDFAGGCRRSIYAAREMSKRLAELNRSLAHDLDEPLRIGIGIHAGPAIVGEMGYGSATGVTAIGDTVNTASRLETATKEFGAELVVSHAVAEAAGIDLSRYPSQDISLRGRSETVAARVIEQAQTLGEDILGEVPPS